MRILHDNVIEREDVDENFEKSFLFFLTTRHSEIDLFEVKISRSIKSRTSTRFDALSTTLENSRKKIVFASNRILIAANLQDEQFLIDKTM